MPPVQGAFFFQKAFLMSKQFDVVVIGGGPGGYIAAIRAAQLGFQVACIDEWKNAAGGPAPGGTCTNVGCIPSKALLQSSEHFDHANHHFADHGIRHRCEDGRGQDVGPQRHGGEAKQRRHSLPAQKNKVTFFHGRGSFAGQAEGGYTIFVAGKSEENITAKQVIMATGSNARALPGTPFDEVNVLSNDGALRVGAVPKKLAVIGSGVIGLEMGSVWRRLGADVTILEGLPTFLGAVDEQIAKEAKKAFDKQGLKIELGVKVGEIKSMAKRVSPWHYTNAKGEAVVLDADKLIVSIGRVPNTIGLNAEAVGLQLGRTRCDCGRRRLQNQLARRLGCGRRGAWPHAGAQGRRRGRGGGRAHRGPAWPRQLQHRPLGHLHQPRDRLGGPHRAATQGRWRGVQSGLVPVPGQRPCPRLGGHHRHGEVAGRCQDRRNLGCSHRGPARL
jgi:dihydrolipoamide dehydrogenase